MKNYYFIVLLVGFLPAINVSFNPYKITQPTGEVIDCFISGDEYFNWAHDRNGFTLIQSHDDGYTNKREIDLMMVLVYLQGMHQQPVR